MVSAHSKPTTPIRTVRCAVYVRKSNVTGLDGDFSSLVTQAESCANYIRSMASQGWVRSPIEYSDGGYTGANTDRPGFQKLFADVQAGEIDAVVVYRIDRLSRSLPDFVRLMDVFEQHGVSFVSVTERFDSSSSMGKLTFNILMSFAQFEREVTRERILDKVAAAKKHGRHTGGPAVLGFTIIDKRLVVVPEEGALVRKVFERFCQLKSTTKLTDELNRDGYCTKSWPTATGRVMGGKPWTKAHLYALINNPKYIGKVEHKGTLYDGEHAAIVSQALWDEAHAILSAQHTTRGTTRHETPALLRGIIKCGHCGCSMGPTFTKRRGRTYRFYLCVQASKKGYATCPVKSVAAGSIEAAVIGQLRVVLRSPELVARTYREARLREAEEIDRLHAEGDDAGARLLEAHAITENEVIDALQRFDGVWSELFPAEQARIVQLLVERVDVAPDGLELRIRADGLKSLLAELKAKNTVAACP